MATRKNALDDARRDIDKTDDSIHALIMRRAELVAAAGAAKIKIGGGDMAAYRPGREAVILRRLLGRHQGRLPRAVIVRLWREIISAGVGLQGAFSVAVHAPVAASGFRNLALDHFGAATELLPFRSASQVLQAVDEGTASVGVLAVPGDGDTDPWWPNLTSVENKVRIVSRLPILAKEEGERRDGLVVAPFERDATDDEVSLLAIEALPEVSRDRLKTDLATAGITATWVAALPGDEDSDLRMHLIAAQGYFDDADPRIAAFREKAGETVWRATVIGGYAAPLGAEG